MVQTLGRKFLRYIRRRPHAYVMRLLGGFFRSSVALQSCLSSQCLLTRFQGATESMSSSLRARLGSARVVLVVVARSAYRNVRVFVLLLKALCLFAEAREKERRF